MAGNTLDGFLIEVGADLGRFESDMSRAARLADRESRRMAKVIRDQTNEIQKSLEGMALRVEAQNTGLVTSAKGVALALGVSGVAILRQFTQAADAAGQFEARMRQATSGAQEYQRAQSRIDQIARDAHKSVSDVSEAFLRSVEPMRQLGFATRTTLDLTEAISLSLVTSAANAQKSASTIDAFGKAMQTGALRGDEFKTVLQNAPTFITALENALGKSRAQLIAMANAGELTVGKLALVSSEIDRLRGEANAMPATLEDAATRFGDSFTRVADGINKSTGAIQGVVRTMDFVGDHLAELITLTTAFGAAHAIAFGAASAKRLMETAAATDTEIVKTRQLTAVQIESARAAEAQALASLNLQRARGVEGLQATQLIAAEKAYAAAQANTAAAIVANNAAMAAQTGLMARFGSGLLALAGGPIGAVVLALGALGYAVASTMAAERERAEALKQSLDTLKEATDATYELVKANKSLTETPALGDVMGRSADNVELLVQKTAELAKAQADLAARSDENLRSIARFGVEASGMDEARARVAALAGEVDRLGKAQNALAADILQRLSPAIQKGMVASLDVAIERFEMLRNVANIGELFVTLDRMAGAFSGTVSQAERADALARDFLSSLGQRNQQAIEDLKTAGMSAGTVAKQWADAGVEMLKAAGYSDEFIAGKRAEIDTYVKNVAAIDAAKKAAQLKAEADRKAKKAADDLKKANADVDEALRTQLETLDPLHAAWTRFNEGVVGAVKAYEDQIAKGVDQQMALAAMQAKILGLAAARDADVRAIREQIDIWGQFQKQIDRDRTLVGMTERQRAIELAVQRVTAQYEDNVRAGLAMGRSLESMVVDVRAAEGAFYDYSRSIEEWNRLAEQFGEDASRAFGDFAASAIFDFDSLGDAFKDLGESLRNTAQRVVADLIAEFWKLQVINPLLNQILGVNLQTGGSMLSGAFGGGGGMLSGITQAFSGQGGIFSSQNWISAGRSLWSGFFGTGTATAAAFGSSTAFTGLGSFGWAGATPWMTSSGMVGLGGAGMTASPWATGSGLAGLGGGGYGAAGGGAASAAASSMAVPIAGWIVAAVLANLSAYQSGWRGDFGSLDMSGRGALANGLTGGGAWASAASGELFRGLGLGGELSNLLSGEALWGRLLGRQKPKMTGYGADWTFGPDGAGGQSFVDWKAKGGWFSSDKRGTEYSDLTAEMQRQIEAFWESVLQSVEGIARRFGSEAPQTIEATFRQTFDKEGKLKESIGTILGETYNEAWEVFAQRIQAENMIAALGMTDIGAGASELAERWRDDAVALLDGAQFLVQAADDIRRGVGLLGEKAGLAGVVGLVEDLAYAGEAMTAAYSRIYESTQLFEQALALAGVELDRSREAIVRFAADVTEAAGGLDQARSLWQGYFDAFYSAGEIAAQQLQQLRAASEQALAGLGLGSGVSMEAFREQFEAAIPTLTPEQVVTWLEAANALAAMTAATADLTNQAQGLLDSLGLTGFGLSAARREILGIEESGRQAAEAANALARAQGRAGASAVELARIQQWTASQIEAAIRRLQQATMDMLAELRGGVPGSLDAINDRIADLEGAMGGVAGAIDSVADSGQRLFEQWASGVQSVQDYLDSMLLGDLSALNPAEQLAEARRQLEEMAAAAAGGDAGALANLPGLSDVYLRMLREFGASGADYNEGFGWVRDLLGGLINLPNPGASLGGAGTGAGTTTYVAPSPELIELYNQRDALLAEHQAQHQAALWAQVVQNIADLAYLMQKPVLEVMDLYQVSLRELADGLGIDLTNLTAASVLAIGNMATTLGLALTDITTGLGINLTDLAAGLTELTGRVGIDLGNLTVESTRALADLAGALGGDLSDLATALGLDLGALANAQGLLNQALAAEINGLPADQRDLLAPLFEAIAAATSEADANAAIAALEAAVLGLPPDLQNLLAPYLAGVGIAPELSDLDYLSDIHDVSLQQRDLLTRIADNLRASNQELGIPAYASGTGYVPRTGLALIHQGEAVLPAAVAEFVRREGLPGLMSGGGNSFQRSETRDLKREVVALRRAVEQAGRDNVAATIAQTSADRQNTQQVVAAVASRDRSVKYGR